MPDDGGTVTPITEKRRGNKRGRQPAGAIGPISGHAEITAERREARAIELRLRRYTLQQIADELGYANPSGAYKAIMRGLVAEYPEEQREKLRREELANINEVQRLAYPYALEGDQKAWDTLLKCSAQRSKLLGLDAPVQVAVSTREGEAVQVSVTHTLEPEVMAAARLIRERVVQASLARSGDVVDVIPPADPV